MGASSCVGQREDQKLAPMGRSYQGGGCERLA